MNIHDISEKSKVILPLVIKRGFIPLLVISLTMGAYGLGRLYVVEHSKVPIYIEDRSVSVDQKELIASSSPSVVQLVGKYVASRGGTTYYLPHCSGASRISDKNKIWFQTKEEAERFGYSLSKTCKDK